MDVLVPIWSSPIPAFTDYVDPIYPVNEMGFECLAENGAIDAMFNLSRLQEQYREKGQKL